MNYKTVFVGGTFDGLHAGHIALLSRAFEEGERIVIGLTSDAFVKKFKGPGVVIQNILQQRKRENARSKQRTMSGTGTPAQYIQPFYARRNDIVQWLSYKKLTFRADIIAIDDPYEPAASAPDYEAIVATDDNKHRVEEINAMRTKKILQPLELLLVSLLPAEDGNPISSTRVRNREIDATGKLVMPESLRVLLGKPMGPVLQEEALIRSIAIHTGTDRFPELTGPKFRESGIIITVGDLTTKTILDAGVTPFLSIVDGKVGRKPYPDATRQGQALSDVKILKIKSGPGFISGLAQQEIQHILHDIGTSMEKVDDRARPCHLMIVEGEEDLLTLPVVAYAPIGSVVYYGQPRTVSDVLDKPKIVYSVPGKPKISHGVLDKQKAGFDAEGIVEVVVTKEKQNEARAYLKKFIDDERD